MVQVPIELARGCEGADAHPKSRHSSKASLENRGQVHNVAAGEEKQTGGRETIISSRPTDVDEKPKMGEPQKKEETKTENR